MKNTQLPGFQVKSVHALKEKLGNCISKHMPRNLYAHTAPSSSNPQGGAAPSLRPYILPKVVLMWLGGVTGAARLKGKGN